MIKTIDEIILDANGFIEDLNRTFDAENINDSTDDGDPSSWGAREADVEGFAREVSEAKRAAEEAVRNAAQSMIDAVASFGKFSVVDRGFLGFENPITFAQTLDVVRPANTTTIFSFGGTARFNTTGFIPPLDLGRDDTPSATWVELGGSFASARFSQGWGVIDPMGDTLLLPGPGGGATGFALASFGGLNVVTDALYSAEYTFLGGTAAVGQTIALGGDGATISGGFGIGYSNLQFQESFSGSIIGYGRDFLYHPDANINQFRVFTQAGVNVPVAPRVSLFANGKVGADFNFGSGRDCLDFTGFATTCQALSASNTDLYASIEGGIRISVNDNFNITARGGVERKTGLPAIMRDGVGPSQLMFGSGINAFVGIDAILTY